MAYCLLLCNEIIVITEYTKSVAVNASGWTHTMFFWETNLVLIFCCGNHLVNSYVLLFLLFDFICVLSRCSWEQPYCCLGQIHLPQAWSCTSTPGHPAAQTTGYSKIRHASAPLLLPLWLTFFQIISSGCFCIRELSASQLKQGGLMAPKLEHMKNRVKDPLVFWCHLLFQKALSERHPISGGFSAKYLYLQLFSPIFEQLSLVTLLNTIPRPSYLEL